MTHELDTGWGRESYCPNCRSTGTAAFIGKLCWYCNTGKYAAKFYFLAGVPPKWQETKPQEPKE